MPTTQTRRRFLTRLSAVGAAGAVRAPRALAAEGALETTSVRLPKFLSVYPVTSSVPNAACKSRGE